MIDVDDLADALCGWFHDPADRPANMTRHAVDHRLACPLHTGVAIAIARELEYLEQAQEYT